MAARSAFFVVLLAGGEGFENAGLTDLPEIVSSRRRKPLGHGQLQRGFEVIMIAARHVDAHGGAEPQQVEQYGLVLCQAPVEKGVRITGNGMTPRFAGGFDG
jgi:hypothetical protein